ncbi:MAG: NUDIX domain-containing protein [Angustibacter sp.]
MNVDLTRGARSGPPLALVDVCEDLPVISSEVVLDGAVWDVRRDDVDLGSAGVVTREVIDHPGAVGVLALDDQGRVPLVCQYRHPVRMRMWELPAGLLDVAGEQPHRAAVRELAEEADLRAGIWHTVIDWMLSPGGSSEAFRVYLARDLSPVPEAERHQREAEELDMPTGWFELDDIRAAIFAGRLHSPSLIVGVLTACALRETGWVGLRPADAPWPEHPHLRTTE